MSGRYEARGIEAEYAPGSRGRVPRNLHGKRAYFAAIQAVFDADYGPLQACFEAVIRRSLRPYGERV